MQEFNEKLRGVHARTVSMVLVHGTHDNIRYIIIYHSANECERGQGIPKYFIDGLFCIVYRNLLANYKARNVWPVVMESVAGDSVSGQ